MPGKILLFCLLTALNAGGTAHAGVAARSFKLERGTVKLAVPDNWQSAPGLFGMPLVLLGPEKKGSERRPVITVVPTGAEVSFDAEGLKEDQAGYRTGREAWLQKMNGRSLAYFGYENPQWPGASEVHQIGYRYELNGHELVERSYTVVCAKHLYQLKTVLTGEQDVAQGADVASVVRSFACE